MSSEAEPSTFVLAVHLALAVALSAGCIWAVARVRLRVRLFALGLCAWLGVSFALARSGWLLHSESVPPRALFLLAPGMLISAALALSHFGRVLIEGLPLYWLVGYQGFRIAVELVLWLLFREGVLPEQMTFEGANLDIISGVSAILVAALIARGICGRWLVWIWNCGSLLLLANIVIIAVRSMPGPWRAYHEGPANVIVLSGVFVWIPALYVLAAWFGHVLVFRALGYAGGHAAPADPRPR